MTTHYKQGYAFERRVWKFLENEKEAYVIRSGQSKGIVDLYAAFPMGSVLVLHMGQLEQQRDWYIQCKRTGLIGHVEWNNLYNCAKKYGKIPVLAKMPDGKTRGIEFWKLTGEAEKNERDRLSKKAELLYIKK